MQTEYPCLPLGDVYRLRSGYAFKSKDWEDTGVPVVKIANVKAGELVMDGCSYVSTVIAEEASEWRLKEGDILIAMTGYIGEIARVRNNSQRMLNQRVGRFENLDPDTIDDDYFFYILRSQEIKKEIEALGYGSAQPNISPKLIHGIEIPLPLLPEQRAIASVLGSLDDKIELNRRMNRTLEQMAAAIFKAWFVDFEPVRAKASGAASFPGMSQPVFDALPATFADSERGPIPEGWEVRSLDEIADYLNGLALQKFPEDDGPSLPRLKIAQLRKGNTEGADMSNSKMPEKYIIRDGDVIFSWSGSLLVNLWTGGKAALNQHLFKVTSDEYPKWLYYLWTAHHLEDFQRTAASKATTMGHIKRHHLSDAKVAVPPVGSAEPLASMTESIQPLLDLVIANDLESRTLAETRDALLPKLLSGEVRVEGVQQ